MQVRGYICNPSPLKDPQARCIHAMMKEGLWIIIIIHKPSFIIAWMHLACGSLRGEGLHIYPLTCILHPLCMLEMVSKFLKLTQISPNLVNPPTSPLMYACSIGTDITHLVWFTHSPYITRKVR